MRLAHSISIKPNGTVLSGAARGRELLAELVDQSDRVTGDGKLFVDFSGVEVITSSFFKSSVIAFRDDMREETPRIYPIIVNLNAAVFEEIELYLQQRSDAFWTCVKVAGEISNVCIVGRLSSVLAETFDHIVAMGSASAPKLAALHDHGSRVGPTAWNNRLHALAARGLIVEHGQGKTKMFRPLLSTLSGYSPTAGKSARGVDSSTHCGSELASWNVGVRQPKAAFADAGH